MEQQVRMTRAHRVLTGVVIVGAVVIAAIGFAGSYAAVRDLALRKGFGWFANVFPIGIDAGIVVLLSLDLLLTWMRIPFPLLRQFAWLLTAATIAFNGAAAWPDPLGVSMHAVIPMLFIAAVEAARHAVGRIADITADRHMESVRLTRWILAPASTFRLWRRMKLWELRSYEEVIKFEQDRLVYQARLRGHYGRNWRRKAPLEAMMPLKLAKYGIPLSQTAATGLAAAGIPAPARPVMDLPTSATPAPEPGSVKELSPTVEEQPILAAEPPLLVVQDDIGKAQPSVEREEVSALPAPRARRAEDVPGSLPAPAERSTAEPGQEQTPAALPVPEILQGEPTPIDQPSSLDEEQPKKETEEADFADNGLPLNELGVVDRYYLAWANFARQHEREPSPGELSALLAQQNLTGRNGSPISPATLRRYLPEFRVYTVWANHLEEHGDTPDAQHLAHLLQEQGITGKSGTAYGPDYLERYLPEFSRRHQELSNLWTLTS